MEQNNYVTLSINGFMISSKINFKTKIV